MKPFDNGRLLFFLLKKHTAMNNNVKLLHFAMQGVKAQLIEYQDQLLKQKMFGSDAVIYPDIHKPGNMEQANRLSNLNEQYQTALKFAQALQRLIDNVNNRYFDEAMKEFLNQKA